MPFFPLPENVAELLENVAQNGGNAVELGCGDGRLTELCRQHGVELIGIDHLGPEAGTTARIVGDVRHPPVAVCSLDLLVAGNVVRHLLVGDRRCEFLHRWRELLPRSGRLLILEDEPTYERPAAFNYASWQDFLRTLSGGRRGPLLSMAAFRDLLPADERSAWTFGRQRNKYPLEPQRVLDLLSGGKPERLSGEVGRLWADIKETGMDYGDFWWAYCPGTGR